MNREFRENRRRDSQMLRKGVNSSIRCCPYLITSVKSGKENIHSMLLSLRDFRENPCAESHALFHFVYKILPVF